MAICIGRTHFFIPSKRLSLNGTYQAEMAINDKQNIVMSMMYILWLANV
jgi:hypothetical protein